ncbi:MAG: hypothetical protein IT317_02420 [Anaerolineales bacterium]|nr:hypothetical protein [Anaerolineales bacterium]
MPDRRLALPLIALLLLGLACGAFVPSAPPTPTARAVVLPVTALPPTDTSQPPAPVCTAPACAAGEVLACLGDCPGGCGTTCVTPTPPVPADAYCLIVVRTPAPEMPTASSNGTPLPRQVDPHVEVCLSATEVTVGQPVVLVGRAVDIGLPAWSLAARENEAGEFEPVVTIDGAGQVALVGTARSILSFVEAERSLDGVVLHFVAQANGQVEWQLSATGEVHYGYPGPAMWAGGTADVVTVYVAGP